VRGIDDPFRRWVKSIKEKETAGIIKNTKEEKKRYSGGQQALEGVLINWTYIQLEGRIRTEESLVYVTS